MDVGVYWTRNVSIICQEAERDTRVSPIYDCLGLQYYMVGSVLQVFRLPSRNWQSIDYTHHGEYHIRRPLEPRL